MEEWGRGKGEGSTPPQPRPRSSRWMARGWSGSCTGRWARGATTSRSAGPGVTPGRRSAPPTLLTRSGVTPRTHPLVQAAIAANRILGKDAELASASTDANVPIALGVPAIALGAGGKAGDAHLTSEWYENTEGALGIIRALLVTAAVAEVE